MTMRERRLSGRVYMDVDERVVAVLSYACRDAGVGSGVDAF